ncbi:ABC transporter ATP-binding protein [Haloarchaeobius sp. FL176]|uniref:ABC transporter ATP-binding protein n=1 Tax=Haloarchaeobius sp. FL176 TaxID=2967129 RepID=UPI002148D314|nr:ABC transporter ATP-binding protein [Haloarchaeobius sp. FL176]
MSDTADAATGTADDGEPTDAGREADTMPSPDPAVDPTTAALATDGLRRTFGEVTAVDRVSLGVERGELRAIIGPNGAGKTTLFNTIMGTLPPTDGRVFLDGQDVTERDEHERPHLGLARSFQSNELFEEQTVLENVRVVVQTSRRGAFSFDLFRDHRSVGRERALELLDTVGLDALPSTLAKNLSHGDQRRLGIAMALATDPEVLLLDEPTSGMSPGATTATANLIEEIRDELGLTVVLIEHDMDVVLSISDRISVLNRGSLIATGPPEEIQANDAVQDAYLGGMREEL